MVCHVSVASKPAELWRLLSLSVTIFGDNPLLWLSEFKLCQLDPTSFQNWGVKDFQISDL